MFVASSSVGPGVCENYTRKRNTNTNNLKEGGRYAVQAMQKNSTRQKKMISLRNYIVFAGFLLPLLFSYVGLTSSLQIYDNLIHCYRGNYTEPWIGNSLQILLELIRKVEKANPTALDIRILSSNILHQLRLDGIQRAQGFSESPYVTPYGPTGIMVPKFELLLKVISKLPGKVNFQNYLTPLEICTLHKLISSTVEPSARSDEMKTCPEKLGNYESEWTPRNTVKVFADGTFSVVSHTISRCPLEGGIILSQNYNTFSPGTVIASIAAGLLPQMVPLKELIPHQLKIDPYENLETMERRDTQKKIDKLLRSLDALDNTLVAGLVGDLAEVCIRQGPSYGANVSIGLSGYWNDTYFPRAYYLNKHDLWEMTDSEILAGIDGLHLAEYAPTWTNRIRRLRLSQILDMYYSSRGIPTFAIENANQPVSEENSGDDDAVKNRQDAPEQPQQYTNLDTRNRGAFNDLSFGREKFDRYVLGDTIDSACERKKILGRVSQSRLKDQTYFLAQILQFAIKGPAMDDEYIKTACHVTVDRFFDYAEKLLEKLPDCRNVSLNYRRPKIDLTLVLDGSRSRYENLRLISTIAELSDVSIFGSQISVVHGSSGRYIVSKTDSILNAFEQLQNYTGSYPTSLSLSSSLASILRTLGEQSLQEEFSRMVGGISKVIFIVSQTQRINQEDFEDSKRMIEGSFQQFPDLYFVFLTNDRKTFESLTESVIKSSLQKDQYIIIESKDLGPKDFATRAKRTLRLIPKRLLVPQCDPPSIPVDSNSTVMNSTRLEYEDYVSPHQSLYYRLRGPLVDRVRVIFQGMGYGGLTVCKVNNSNVFQCLSMDDMGTIIFNLTQPCDPEADGSCTNILFTVQMDNSYMKCSENDCQYPDQVRFLIRIDNMKCTKDSASLTSSISAIVLLFVPIQMIIVKFLF